MLPFFVCSFFVLSLLSSHFFCLSLSPCQGRAGVSQHLFEYITKFDIDSGSDQLPTEESKLYSSSQWRLRLRNCRMYPNAYRIEAFTRTPSKSCGGNTNRRSSQHHEPVKFFSPEYTIILFANTLRPQYGITSKNVTSGVFSPHI